jgi:hypothetical protein
MLVRLCVRMIILVAFATFGSIGFGASFAALLWMSAVFSAVIAVFRREPLFDTVLNHWDETVIYAALSCLISGLTHTAPF